MEAILARALGSLPAISSSILPVVNKIIDYGPQAMEALGNLSELVSAAGSIGSSFKTVYNQLFKKSFDSQVLSVFSGVETQPAQQTIAACEALTEEIKAAIEAVNTAPPQPEVPKVCNLMSKEFQPCGPEFITETKSKLEMLNSELEIAQCKLKGLGLMKLLEQQKLDTCSYALNSTNAKCKAQTTPPVVTPCSMDSTPTPPCSAGVPTTTPTTPPCFADPDPIADLPLSCSTNPNTANDVPPPPIETESCGCKRKKKTYSKRKAKKATKPCSLRPLDNFLIEPMRENEGDNTYGYGLRYF